MGLEVWVWDLSVYVWIAGLRAGGRRCLHRSSQILVRAMSRSMSVSYLFSATEVNSRFGSNHSNRTAIDDCHHHSS